MSFEFNLNEITQAPQIEENELREILEKSYGIINGKITELSGYEDSNFRMDESGFKDGRCEPKSVIIKITNPIEARQKEHMDLQVEVCDFLSERRIPTPTTLQRLDGKKWGCEQLKGGVRLPIRVFHVLPGSHLEDYEFTPELVAEIGSVLARVHLGFDQFKGSTPHLPFISPDNFACMKREAENLFSMKIVDEHKRKLVIDILEKYENCVSNRKELFDVGLIHSDLNETNLLVIANEEKPKISGLVDFGDAHVSTRALDIAATVLYLQLSDKLKQGVRSLARNVLYGYRSIRPFNDDSILLICMRARLACSLIYGLRTARINYRGGSVDYVLKVQSNGWDVLKELCELESL